jgi:hypothetical protein
MNPITNETALDFIRMLVNLGGVDLLKEPEMIILNPQGEPRCIADGDKQKPIQIIVPGMVKDDNNFLFNPLKSVEGNNPAYNWFYNSRGSNIATVTKMIMAQIIALAVEKETSDYESLQLITEISGSCDAQTQQELLKINAADILRVFYNKKIKTAEAQTYLLSDEIETEYRLKKRTWTIIRKIFRTIFDLDKDETTMSKYRYRAKILNIPEIDSKLHVISQLIKKLEPWGKLIGAQFEPEKFEEHLQNLEAYSRMYAWFTARSVNDQMVINNQQRSAGLPVRPQVQDDTTIKLGSAPVLDPQPVQPMTAYTPMTAYPNTMQAYPPMTAYGMPMTAAPVVVEHDRIALS